MDDKQKRTPGPSYPQSHECQKGRRSEDDANAQLIADLLEALELAESANDDDSRILAAKKRRAAIAKAKGQMQ